MISIDYQYILEEIGDEVKPSLTKGKVADYIPALSRVAPGQFGMAVKLITGEEYIYGDAE
ncbi:MAG: glutaminase, partial [Bacteroidota bacterium]